MNLLLLVFISTSTVFALTSQERRDISTAATEADLLIDFFTYLQITPLIASPIDPKEKLAHGPLIMFFGARWCINTKRFNPKYLQVQQQVKMNGLNVSMGKVECSLDHEEFCLNHFKVDGFPTILTYVDGIFKEEYMGDIESDPFYSYVEELGSSYYPSISAFQKNVSSTSMLQSEADLKPQPLSTPSVSATPLSLYIALGVLIMAAAGYAIIRYRKTRMHPKKSSGCSPSDGLEYLGHQEKIPEMRYLVQ